MFTQSQFFRILSLSVLFFFARTLTAVTPLKTGAQVAGTDAPMDWLAFFLNFVFWGFIIGGFFFAGISLIGLRKEQKFLNDLDND